MDSEVIIKIVKTLVGEIESIGDANADKERYKNLKVMGKVLNELVYDIGYECRQVRRYEGSMKQSGHKSIEILKFLKNIIDEALEEYDNV